MSRKYGHLLRVLGIAFGWAVTIGNTIGAGILRAPGEVARNVPAQGAFYGVWLAGGAFALLGALSLAELGTMIPRSGGQTVFVRRAFGAFPGFAVAWSDWLSTCASAAAITIVLVDALVALAPRLGGAHGIIAAAVVLAFTGAQWRSARSGSIIQVVTSALKAAAFGALIVACFAARQPAAHATSAVAALTAAGIVASLQLMIYTYDGWAAVLYFSGEMANPGRDIPRSMFTGIVSVTVIYLLVNAAFLHLIPMHAMAGDQMVADTASKIAFGSIGTAVVRALIAVSLLSAINSCILMGARTAYAVGAARVNAGGTPTLGLALTTLATLGFLTSGAFNNVIAMAAFFFVANYTASFASVFRLRRREPHTPRPYRAWGYPYTTALMLLFCLAFLGAVVVTDPRNSIYAIVLLAVSYPIHRIMQVTLPNTEMEPS